MAKFWSLLLAFILSGLPLRFDGNVKTPYYHLSEGFHAQDDCVPRSYDVWIVETDHAIYQIEKYDQAWDWAVARSEAVEIALRLENTLGIIVTYCGSEFREKVQVEIISMDPSDPLLEKPYVTRDKAVLTFQHIRKANYTEALSRVYLHDMPPWVAFGVTGVIDGDILDESFLADYFSLSDTDLLRLTSVRFSEAICGNYDVVVAKGVATSLVRFIKKQCYFNTLLEVVRNGNLSAIKQAWLQSIGVSLPYDYADEIFWEDVQFFRNAWAPLLIEKGDACFEICMGAEYPTIEKNQQPSESKLETADDFERMIVISATTQKNIQETLKTVVSEDRLKIEGGTLYLVDPYSFSIYTDTVNGKAFPYVSNAYAYLPRTLDPCSDDLGKGTLAYVIANQLAHIYLDTQQWDVDEQWLQRGIAVYIAMTLPRGGDWQQNLDAAYAALLAVSNGEYPEMEAPKETVSQYYDTVLNCYLEMGGTLADASAFDPVIYANAAAYATMQEMTYDDTWDRLGIYQESTQDNLAEDSPAQRLSTESMLPDELITSFVCYLVQKASLSELISTLMSEDGWETVYEKTYSQLFDDWKASLPYVLAVKNDWREIQ